MEKLTLAALVADRGRFHPIYVRDAEDCAAAHVVGAVHIPLVERAVRADETPAGNTPATICGKGAGRSIEGAYMLKMFGHQDAHWLKGGTTGGLGRNT